MPDWLGWLLTAAFLGVAAHAVARLAGHDQRVRTVAAADALMATGMAVMCSPVGGPLPMAGWQTVFLLFTVWFAARGEFDHAVAGLAMLYMLTAVPHSAHAMSAAWSPPMAGEAALPLLGWVFVAYFVVQAARIAPQLASVDRRLAAGCRGVMALGTGGVIVALL
ncbi:DUF5134 domain-containing protein [Actinokineospora sp. HUAS TT18]|uniref:DUF5134 domain-containing protein n=1 Tax=Actinokineospora sp. HUAS TT18 TaxID=3447451 RepID=UPI003F522426